MKVVSLFRVFTCSARIAQRNLVSVFRQPLDDDAVGPAKALLYAVFTTAAMSAKLFRIVLKQKRIPVNRTLHIVDSALPFRTWHANRDMPQNWI